MAFVRRPGTLPKYPEYLPDLAALGYRLGDDDKFYHKDAPDLHFSYRISNDEFINQLNREAMHDVIRNIVIDRFEEIGLKQFFLPTFAYEEPDHQTPTVPILITPHKALLKKKRVFVFIGSSDNDLGTLSYRLLERHGGLEKGSLLEYVRKIFRTTDWPTPNVDASSREKGERVATEVSRGVKEPDDDEIRQPDEYSFQWERSRQVPPPSDAHCSPSTPNTTAHGDAAEKPNSESVPEAQEGNASAVEKLGEAEQSTHKTPSSKDDGRDSPETSLKKTSDPSDKSKETSDKLHPSALDDETPGIVILNPGQLRYTYKPSKHKKRPHPHGRAVNRDTWTALPRPYVGYPAARVKAHNTIPENEDIHAHIDYVFKHIINNTAFVDRSAELHFIAMEEGADALVDYLQAFWCWPFSDFTTRIRSVALMGPTPIHRTTPPWDLSDSRVWMKSFWTLLRERGRIWSRSKEKPGTPLSSSTYLPLIQNPTTRELIEEDLRLQPPHGSHGLFMGPTAAGLMKRMHYENEIYISPVVSGGHGTIDELMLPRCWPDVLRWQLMIERLGDNIEESSFHNEVFPIGQDELSSDDEMCGAVGYPESESESGSGS